MTVDEDDPRHLQVARALQHGYEQKWLACRTRCSALVADNDQLRAKVLALKQERDEHAKHRANLDRKNQELQQSSADSGEFARKCMAERDSARESARRLRELLDKASLLLDRCDCQVGQPSIGLWQIAYEALIDDPTGQEGERTDESDLVECECGITFAALRCPAPDCQKEQVGLHIVSEADKNLLDACKMAGWKP